MRDHNGYRSRERHEGIISKFYCFIIHTWWQWASLFEEAKCCRSCHPCAPYTTLRCSLSSKGRGKKKKKELFTIKSTVANPCISIIPALDQPEPIWWPCSESCFFKTIKPNCLGTGNCFAKVQTLQLEKNQVKDGWPRIWPSFSCNLQLKLEQATDMKKSC